MSCQSFQKLTVNDLENWLEMLQDKVKALLPDVGRPIKQKRSRPNVMSGAESGSSGDDKEPRAPVMPTRKLRARRSTEGKHSKSRAARNAKLEAAGAKLAAAESIVAQEALDSKDLDMVPFDLDMVGFGITVPTKCLYSDFFRLTLE